MSRVIAIANQKGGVGKTTTAINLGASLAVSEQRTLVVDIDPQANASSGLGVRPGDRPTIYNVLIGPATADQAVIRQVHFPFLDLIPSSRDLVGAEIELVETAEREKILRRGEIHRNRPAQAGHARVAGRHDQAGHVRIA